MKCIQLSNKLPVMGKKEWEQIILPSRDPYSLMENHSLELMKRTGHMEKGRGSCLEHIHARPVWFLGLFWCHIFLLGSSVFNGSGPLLFSKCWGLMERRVPILSRPPGTKKPPGKACFASVGLELPSWFGTGFHQDFHPLASRCPSPANTWAFGTGQPKTQERPVGQVEV